jgi:hypothetical protein
MSGSADPPRAPAEGKVPSLAPGAGLWQLPSRQTADHFFRMVTR